MANDILFQHLMRHLYPYFYVKYHEYPEKFEYIEPFVPKGHLRNNLFQMIAKAMYGLGHYLTISWFKGLEEYTSLSLKDFEVYTWHVLMFCMEKKLLIDDVYERFINVCALVTATGAHTLCFTNRKFYKLVPVILTVFFERVLKEDFRKEGGWKGLEKYLLSQDYLELYEICSALHNSRENRKTVQELNRKMLQLSLRRKHVYSPFPNIEKWAENTFVTDLTAEVISSIDTSLLTELRTYTLDFSLHNELIPAVKKLSIANEFRQRVKAFGEGGACCWNLSYHTCLEKHILNLKRLVSMNTKYSNSLHSSDNARFFLFTGLSRLQLKLEQVISLLEPLLK